MSNKWWRVSSGVAIGLWTCGAFMAGRHLEERKIAERTQPTTPPPIQAAVSGIPAEEAYRELAIDQILRLSFGQFYEALRSAPREARQEWAAELEKMPTGPRKSAAISAFYKLLVQFDPPAAARAVLEIKDKELQAYALSKVVQAAPSFALREMAELMFSLPNEVREGIRGNLPSELLEEWSEIDPAAVALFIENLPKEDYSSYYYDRALLKNFAAVDPEAALAWANRHQPLCDTNAFFEGWYLNDHEAAVAYALAHAGEVGVRTGLPGLLRSLYHDSPKARKNSSSNYLATTCGKPRSSRLITWTTSGQLKPPASRNSSRVFWRIG